MIFVVKDADVGLRQAPRSDAEAVDVVIAGDQVEQIADTDNPAWIKVTVLPEKRVEGFLPLAVLAVESTPNEPIDEQQFFVATDFVGRVSAIDGEYLYGLAVALSGLKNNTTPGTDLTGPYRFSIQRWADLVARFGSDENITADDRTEPLSQVVLAGRYCRLLTDALKASLNRDPNLNELCVGHVLGEDAAPILLAGDPGRSIAQGLANQPGVDAVQKEVAGNPTVFPDAAATTMAQALAAAAAALTPGLAAAARLRALLNPTEAPAPGPIHLNLSGLTPAQTAMAQKIMNAFAAAGFDQIHQVCALANAKRESELNPKLINDRGEFSVGLFQLNMKGGEGVGHQESELLDPDRNIAIVVAAARNSKRPFGRNFPRAKTIDEAVGVFVLDFEKPKNPRDEIALRLKVARQFLA